MSSSFNNQYNPSLKLDSLYCQEDLSGPGVDKFTEPPLTKNDLFWDDEELLSLLSKEKQETHLCCADFITDVSLVAVRKEAIDWIVRVVSHFGFSHITAVLAANYFDRFISSIYFKKDKPWMSQLSAVVCLSLAAKVEETQVPPLIDLQIKEAKYVFEPSTIQRMELLVLSTLQWKMNPVTPFSFLDHFVRRFEFKTYSHWDFQRRCERILLSLITDSRFMCYPPSVMAIATMYLVINEVEPNNALDYRNQLIDILKIGKGKIDDCCKFILELSGSNACNQNRPNKRKYQYVPASPNGVMDANFSRDNSNDSWDVGLASSSPVPLFKRQMRLAPINRLSIGLLCNPH